MLENKEIKMLFLVRL